ncbi:MAG: response regulator transcription factor [Xanthomonadales bacterium]|nr:response regulator transcription factor [Gammaproteobacteria bacterium]MBT8055136.1 response regulator transcription factor [Gammaproteobacteria bacterium]NND58375.1 response regulator transcription factor [Xanthomonadales bacterium]NNK51730.1 response regulator transcription factor [Xanthomonadales bacterium]
MRVLIIEDNPDIAANLGDYLEDHGHTVDFAGDGITGLHLAVVNEFDAIVLDLALPGMDGLDVCRKLRAEAGKETPVLMLTARDRLEDKLAGFETGADDYLVKPFELQEVEARLKVLAGRGRRKNRRELKVGDLVYNLDTLNVSRGDQEIYLNPIGLKLLHCLMEASPNVVSRAELEMEVWGEEMPDSDSLRVHIHSLRSAIDKPFETNMIQTRHGIGYRLVEPDAVSS